MSDDDIAEEFKALCDSLLALQREIDALNKTLGEAPDPEGGLEERVQELQFRRTEAMRGVGRHALRWMMRGNSVVLEAASDDATAPDDVPLYADAPTEPLTEAEPPAEAAPPDTAPPETKPRARSIDLSKLVALGPTWSREGAQEPEIDLPALTTLVAQFAPKDYPSTQQHEGMEREIRAFLVVTAGMDSWIDLYPREVQQALVGYIIARVRHLQGFRRNGFAPDFDTDTLVRRLASFMGANRPGFVYGISRNHHDPRERSWSAAADKWWALLQTEVAEPPAPSAQARRRRPRDEDDDEDEERAPRIPDDWPFFSVTRGRNAYIFGGSPREEARKALEEAFGFASLEWISTEHERQVATAAQRIRTGAKDFAILLTGFCGHFVDEKVVPACKDAGAPWVRIQRGYGVTRIRHAIERHFQHIASDGAEMDPTG